MGADEIKITEKEMNKICRKCLMEKDISEFYRVKESIDNHSHSCISCKAAWAKEHYKKNIDREKIKSRERYKIDKEKMILQNKIWCKNNPEKRRKSAIKYYLNNKDKIQMRAKEYRENNKEKVRIINSKSGKKWFKNNKEKRMTTAKKWNKKNPIKYAQYSKEWRKRNPEKFLMNMKNTNHKRRSLTKSGKISSKEWETIKKQAKFKCHWCKEKIAKLTMDHVIPLSKGGIHVASNIVPACLSCNSSKGAKILTLL